MQVPTKPQCLQPWQRSCKATAVGQGRLPTQPWLRARVQKSSVKEKSEVSPGPECSLHTPFCATDILKILCRNLFSCGPQRPPTASLLLLRARPTCAGQHKAWRDMTADYLGVKHFPDFIFPLNHPGTKFVFLLKNRNRYNNWTTACLQHQTFPPSPSHTQAMFAPGYMTPWGTRLPCQSGKQMIRKRFLILSNNFSSSHLKIIKWTFKRKSPRFSHKGSQKRLAAPMRCEPVLRSPF